MKFDHISLNGILKLVVDKCPTQPAYLMESNIEISKGQYARSVSIARFISVCSKDRQKAIATLQSDLEKLIVNAATGQYRILGFLAKPSIHQYTTFNGDEMFVAFCYPFVFANYPGQEINLGVEHECTEGEIGRVV